MPGAEPGAAAGEAVDGVHLAPTEELQREPHPRLPAPQDEDRPRSPDPLPHPLQGQALPGLRQRAIEGKKVILDHKLTQSQILINWGEGDEKFFLNSGKDVLENTLFLFSGTLLLDEKIR